MDKKTDNQEIPEEKNPSLEPLMYPKEDDVYHKSVIESDIDPDNLASLKSMNESDLIEKDNEGDFSEDKSGDDLDIPGSELDDKQEEVGSEDEENNYYSIGGDNHNDLDEDRGTT